MKCPKCQEGTTITAEEDINNTDCIDLQVHCDDCDWSAYTFVYKSDLVEDEG